MVFTAIVYSGWGFTANQEPWGRVRSITIYQIQTAGAGGELLSHFPGTAAQAQQVAGFLRNKNVRIKRITLSTPTLAAPIAIYGAIYGNTGTQVEGETDRIIMSVNDRQELPVSDCIRRLNWDAYPTVTDFLTLFFTALTITDVIVVWAELEVLE